MGNLLCRLFDCQDKLDFLDWLTVLGTRYVVYEAQLFNFAQ